MLDVMVLGKGTAEAWRSSWYRGGVYVLVSGGGTDLVVLTGQPNLTIRFTTIHSPCVVDRLNPNLDLQKSE